ncbi:hypothetical protein AFK63_12840 [Cronobacter muytjensii ATCC 51329]|nr:hypothetical protein AFK63_12840 [Cronobacter muytjensii ATCC 51329]
MLFCSGAVLGFIVIINANRFDEIVAIFPGVLFVAGGQRQQRWLRASMRVSLFPQEFSIKNQE